MSGSNFFDIYKDSPDQKLFESTLSSKDGKDSKNSVSDSDNPFHKVVQDEGAIAGFDVKEPDDNHFAEMMQNIATNPKMTGAQAMAMGIGAGMKSATTKEKKEKWTKRLETLETLQGNNYKFAEMLAKQKKEKANIATASSWIDPVLSGSINGTLDQEEQIVMAQKATDALLGEGSATVKRVSVSRSAFNVTMTNGESGVETTIDLFQRIPSFFEKAKNHYAEKDARDLYREDIDLKKGQQKANNLRETPESKGAVVKATTEEELKAKNKNPDTTVYQTQIQQQLANEHTKVIGETNDMFDVSEKMANWFEYINKSSEKFGGLDNIAANPGLIQGSIERLVGRSRTTGSYTMRTFIEETAPAFMKVAQAGMKYGNMNQKEYDSIRDQLPAESDSKEVLQLKIKYWQDLNLQNVKKQLADTEEVVAFSKKHGLDLSTLFHTKRGHETIKKMEKAIQFYNDNSKEPVRETVVKMDQHGMPRAVGPYEPGGFVPPVKKSEVDF